MVAVGDAGTGACRRRGRSSSSSPHVLGPDCRLRRRLAEQKEVASDVDGTGLKEMKKVR